MVSSNNAGSLHYESRLPNGVSRIEQACLTTPSPPSIHLIETADEVGNKTCRLLVCFIISPIRGLLARAKKTKNWECSGGGGASIAHIEPHYEFF